MQTAIRNIAVIAAAAIVGVGYFLFQPTIIQKLEACGYEFEKSPQQYVYAWGGLELIIGTSRQASAVRDGTRLMFVARADGTVYLQPSYKGMFTAGELLEYCERTEKQREQSRRG